MEAEQAVQARQATGTTLAEQVGLHITMRQLQVHVYRSRHISLCTALRRNRRWQSSRHYCRQCECRPAGRRPLTAMTMKPECAMFGRSKLVTLISCAKSRSWSPECRPRLACRVLIARGRQTPWPLLTTNPGWRTCNPSVTVRLPRLFDLAATCLRWIVVHVCRRLSAMRQELSKASAEVQSLRSQMEADRAQRQQDDTYKLQTMQYLRKYEAELQKKEMAIVKLKDELQALRQKS
jgi:hypothetical protein|eukprot:COSAG01_NODE_525_length_15926_cov_28.158021_6_plen_236_part_00